MQNTQSRIKVTADNFLMNSNKDYKTLNTHVRLDSLVSLAEITVKKRSEEFPYQY